jgi:hypothetical protein
LFADEIAEPQESAVLKELLELAEEASWRRALSSLRMFLYFICTPHAFDIEGGNMEDGVGFIE